MNIRPDLKMSPGFHYTYFKCSPNYSYVKIYQSISDTIIVPDDNFKSKFSFLKLYYNYKELLIQNFLWHEPAVVAAWLHF